MAKQQVDHVQELARGIKEKMKKTVQEGMFGTGMALGTITTNGLIIDGCDHTFKDYMILDYLTLDDSYYTENTTCHVTHNHEFKTPEPIKRIKIGDRVLIAQFGADNVVVGRVVLHAKLISG